MLALSQKHKAMVQSILQQHIPDQIVWVYGSRIKGTSHEGSDLDLVIAPSSQTLPAGKLSALKTAFSESELPILVDILDWNDIPESFQIEIKKEHLVFAL